MRRPMKCHVNDMSGYVTGVMRARVALLWSLKVILLKVGSTRICLLRLRACSEKVDTCAYRKSWQKFES